MRYWSGLGQPLADSLPPGALITAPAATGYISQRVVDGELRTYPYGYAILFDDGSAYYRDQTSYWQTWEADGFKCWGDAIGGGWKCDDGSSGGNWYTAPRASAVKQKAEAAKAATPAATTPTPTTTPAITHTGDPTITQLPDGSQEKDYPDGSKEILAPDGTYTNIGADGSWNTIDVNGFKCSGDAQGNYLCDDGTCAGAWCPGGGGSDFFSGNTIWILGGAAVVLLLVLSGRRR